MQRKIHLSLMARFPIFAIALILSPSCAATRSAPFSDCSLAQAGTPTEKEGADSFAEVALSGNAHFGPDLDVLPRGLTGANISKTKLSLFVGRVTALGSLDVFPVNFHTGVDRAVVSLLAAISFTLPSDLPTRADVFAGEGE